MIWFILYILAASGSVFGLSYWANRAGCWNPRDDLPWPIICGILWPVAAPIAAAYIAARWYLDSKEE